MAKRYATYEQALRRVDGLRKSDGVWPGIIGPDADGWYRLAYDPYDSGDGES